MDYKQLINKILSLPKDNTLYLLEKFPSDTGLFASNGNVIYLAHNFEQCAAMSIRTNLLNLDTNIYVSAFNETSSSFESGYYNSVEFELSDSSDMESNLGAFVNLCLSHASNMHGQEFMSFFDSLVLLFQLPREEHSKNLVGLMGELMFIEYVHRRYDSDISLHWHTDGPLSRLDFVCPNANFEVKTTFGESLCFVIKHNQLFSCPEKNYLIAVQIEESSVGRTLEEMIETLLEDHSYCNSLRFSISIETEKRRVSPTEMHNRRFLLKKICAYRAQEINPFLDIPDNVEGLTYRINLLPCISVSLDEVFPVE